ncbi:rod shape-determining protein MreC, partial [Candidatus Ichthyocystis hellenicum]|uniref:rod shape-determining protein MreC n=3 Tax=Candidatus Ichthyocystis TaxID=2929841 RepID=UPI0015856A60
ITELPYIVTSALANALTNAKKVSALSMELSHKRIEENYLLSLKEQNENLLHILKLVNENSHTHLVAAQIVQIGLNPFINEITLNKGLSDSIALGDPVINEQGLIGQVTRLYQHHAEVTLLTEINQETPVKILPNNDIGIAFGRGKFIEISYLPDDVKTSPGDSVVTSGLDGLYPGQIKIGTVTKIVTNADKSVRVIAKPIATERLSPYVSVISSPHKVNLGDERYIATQNHLCKQ